MSVASYVRAGRGAGAGVRPLRRSPLSWRSATRAAAFAAPNALTLGRVVGAIGAARAARSGHFRRAHLLLGIAAASDGLDGFTARRLRTATAVGASIDPIADRALFVATLFTLRKLDSCSPALLNLLAIREFALGLVVLSTIDAPGACRGVTRSGKCATALLLSGSSVSLQGTLLEHARLNRVGNALIGASLPFGYVSLGSYAIRRIGRR